MISIRLSINPSPAHRSQLHDLLNAKVKVPGEDSLPDHDFDRIDHANCDYSDSGKGIQIDVDKILGVGGNEVSEL